MSSRSHRAGRLRRAAALLALTLLLPTGSAAAIRLSPSASLAAVDRTPAALAAAVAPMLAARADAFRRHDVTSYLASVDPRKADFVARQRAQVSNAANLTFATYTLEPDVEDVGDLSRERDRRAYGEDTVLLAVREVVAIAGGFDERSPEVEAVFLTLTRDRSGRWLVAADDGVDDIGLQSARHPWDFAPIRTRSSEHFLALFPDNRADEAPKVLSEAEAAFDVVDPVWTRPWKKKVVVELPRNSDELGKRILATFPLDNFVAFAAASVDQTDLALRFSGSRVLINPDNFLGNATAERRRILAHELIHVATRESSGAYFTAWFEEGAAQLLGEGASAVGLTPVADAVRKGQLTGRFPEDYEFLVGGSERIFRSYAEAFLIARTVERLAGREGLIRFYVAAGDAGALGPGIARHRIDLASRKALGISLDELEKRWAAEVRAEF
ncbi:MAG TPA: hypothetical protein VNA14_05290 [Mycobacteriales bacterium]|nr:hypothetical protein [Mycobacteriales bacterium]